MRRGAIAGTVLAMGLATSVTACGGSTSTIDPRALLAQAKQKVDRSSAVHFDLTSRGVTGNGTVITGGNGDIVRPDQIQGTFQLTVGGFTVSVKVVAAHGKFFAQAPFQTGYTATDPATYGVGNPALLIDPNTGLSSLLPAIDNPRAQGQTRVGGELLDQVGGTVPGTKIPVLPDAQPSQPVDVTALVDPSNHELRRIVLTGPFTSSA
ncbi:MAG: LppX_LprAFG lipoprotein, partial [Acidimicrobiales bacterium]